MGYRLLRETHNRVSEIPPLCPTPPILLIPFDKTEALSWLETASTDMGIP